MHEIVKRIVERGQSFRLITGHGSHYVPAGAELERCDANMIHVKGFLWGVEPRKIINIVEVGE